MACFRGGYRIGSMLASVSSGHNSASGSSYEVGRPWTILSIMLARTTLGKEKRSFCWTASPTHAAQGPDLQRHEFAGAGWLSAGVNCTVRMQAGGARGGAVPVGRQALPDGVRGPGPHALSAPQLGHHSQAAPTHRCVARSP